jgi:hypothetical protein
MGKGTGILPRPSPLAMIGQSIFVGFMKLQIMTGYGIWNHAFFS